MSEVDQLIDVVLGATQPPSRHNRWLTVARIVSGVLGSTQIALAIPELFVPAHGEMHSGNHVGAFAIAIGVGLVYAALRPHRATGLIPPLVALTICLLLTCANDIAHGRLPSQLDIHIISPVAAGALWAIAHLARPRAAKPEQRALASIPD